MSTPNKIRKLEQRRERLIGELLKTHAMIRGSFGTVHLKCGASNCWCAQGSSGHPLDRINYSKDGRSRTKAVKAQDVKWAREMTESYKQFRKNRQALRTLEKQINQAIEELETKIVDKDSTAEKLCHLKVYIRQLASVGDLSVLEAQHRVIKSI